MLLPPRWQWKLERWREQLSASLGGSEEKSARPRLCPACGRLVGATATRCHECGASLTFSLAAASRSLGQLLPTETPVTYAVLTANLLLFGLSLILTMKSASSFNLMGSIALPVAARLGISAPFAYILSEPWRLVTANFLHGGLWHFAFNSFALMDIGRELEARYGSARYWFIYVLTGISGFLLSSLMGNLSLGASASLCGLIGLMLAATFRHSSPFARMERAALVRWLVYIFIFGLFTNADHAAHLGGLAMGFLFGRFTQDRAPMTPAERKWAFRLAWLATLVVTVSFAFMLKQFFRTGAG